MLIPSDIFGAKILTCNILRVRSVLSVCSIIGLSALSLSVSPSRSVSVLNVYNSFVVRNDVGLACWPNPCTENNEYTSNKSDTGWLAGSQVLPRPTAGEFSREKKNASFFCTNAPEHEARRFFRSFPAIVSLITNVLRIVMKLRQSCRARVEFCTSTQNCAAIISDAMCNFCTKTDARSELKGEIRARKCNTIWKRQSPVPLIINILISKYRARASAQSRRCLRVCSVPMPKQMPEQSCGNPQRFKLSKFHLWLFSSTDRAHLQRSVCLCVRLWARSHTRYVQSNSNSVCNTIITRRRTPCTSNFAIASHHICIIAIVRANVVAHARASAMGKLCGCTRNSVGT